METIVTIRKAISTDSDGVYRLLRIIADIHRNGRPDMFPNLTSKYTPDEVKQRLSMDESGVFVAEIGGEVMGYVFCDIINEGTGQTLYVDDLCVSPEARHCGIGRKLMDKAQEYGKSKNCAYLMLNVWEFNSDAVKFYEKYGMATRTRHMELKL